MIEDNTALWKLKKVTNFTDTEREIATQAQAEEGVDNTKAMTPLRVTNTIDKKRPIKTFTLLEQLGLTNECTYADIHNALQNGWLFCFTVNKDTLVNLKLPRTGSLLGYRQGARLTLVLTDETIVGYYIKTYSSWGETEWRKILTNSDIATQAEAEAGTDNTKVMTPKGTKQAIVASSFCLDANTSHGGLVPMIPDGTDLNDLTESGTYSCGSASIYDTLVNVPPVPRGNFKLIVSKNVTSVLLQLAIGWNGTICKRSLHDGVIEDWEKLATNGALSMPSNTLISIDKTSTSYTAPCDGWIRVQWNGTTNTQKLAIDISSITYAIGVLGTPSEWAVQCFPVAKGQVWKLRSENTATIQMLTFFYAQSEV